MGVALLFDKSQSIKKIYIYKKNIRERLLQIIIIIITIIRVHIKVTKKCPMGVASGKMKSY